jgi:hypothetical protein
VGEPIRPDHRSAVAAGALVVSARVLWACARLPALALLVVLEPVVSFLLGTFALLLVLTALFLEFASTHAVPFWSMLALAIACVGAQALYHGLVRALS